MYKYKFKLDRVVDGDTIDGHIDLGFNITVFKRVRLVGIDAPETRTTDKTEKALGLESKKWLDIFLSTGEIIIKTANDKTGKYGRILADVYVNDIHVQSEMLFNGLAKVYK